MDLVKFPVRCQIGAGRRLAGQHMKSEQLYTIPSRENLDERIKAAPAMAEAWRHFSQTVFKAGALDEKTKHLIAVAVAHVTQCPYCIHGHTEQAMRHGASRSEIMEAIWVAAEMRSGTAYAHSALAMDEMLACEKSTGRPPSV